MIPRPIVVADPGSGGIAACEALGGAATLAWSDSGALREAADRLHGLGADALMISPGDVAVSTAAMSLRAQMFGHASVVVAIADDSADVSAVAASAHMVARHLPPVPVVAAGREGAALAASLRGPLAELGLTPPTVCETAELAAVVDELTASDSTHPPLATPAGHGCC